ncbi:hypothetical protein P4U90_20495 [Cytobacillus kochii]|uniref:hypothetical protein n=1 Tax=Cytobacillus TaxID=2675230 RepID=UPI00278283FB|nr:hypothetical protein [Cytobacillus kochii]MDQ0187804.1 putative membrane protein [Cytobacillus kochii]MED1607703.1 hypothetical protein [Cytobacillus kochii]
MFGFIFAFAWLAVFIYALKTIKDYINSNDEEKAYEKDFVIKIVGAVCLSGLFVIAEILRVTNLGFVDMKWLFLITFLLLFVVSYVFFTYRILFSKNTFDRKKGDYTFSYKYRKWLIPVFFLFPIGVFSIWIWVS